MKKENCTPTRLCPRVFDNKRKGEWAEMVFMTKATSLGFVVCRPLGDSQGFDLLLCAPTGKVTAVQIKSVWSKTRSRLYGTFSKRMYSDRQFDFFAVLIVPEDTWYILPSRLAAHRRHFCFFPHVPNSRGQFERFREAWHLLLRPHRGRSERGLEIRACADPAYVEEPSGSRPRDGSVAPEGARGS